VAGAILFGIAIAVLSDGHLSANWALQGGFIFFLLHSFTSHFPSPGWHGECS